MNEKNSLQASLFDSYCIRAGGKRVCTFDGINDAPGEERPSMTSQLFRALLDIKDFSVEKIPEIRERFQDSGVEYIIHNNTVYNTKGNGNGSEEAPGYIIGNIYAKITSREAALD